MMKALTFLEYVVLMPPQTRRGVNKPLVKRLEVNNNDIDELAEEDSQELTTEELINLHCVSQHEVVEEFFNVGLRSSHWDLRKDYDSHPETPQKTIYGRSSISR
ncbi:hypothetical protein AVEN_6304-1 [Araneus ventricosus]|uniref:Uncharacterized protein n=1 Tax=Araneus ventricosus TaxID=182803 RepID=A0A4Y2K2K9_ARAVE|nr:hypothetical protein AVEN_6304-1 [Araneus ventricosus]